MENSQVYEAQESVLDKQTCHVAPPSATATLPANGSKQGKKNGSHRSPTAEDAKSKKKAGSKKKKKASEKVTVTKQQPDEIDLALQQIKQQDIMKTLSKQLGMADLLGNGSEQQEEEGSETIEEIVRATSSPEQTRCTEAADGNRCGCCHHTPPGEADPAPRTFVNPGGGGRRRQDLQKKMRKTLGAMEANRRRECLSEDNVKYDKKGKRVGRFQKQMVNIPSGELPLGGADSKNLQQVMQTLADQPDKLGTFLEKLGINQEQFAKMQQQVSSGADTKEVMQECIRHVAGNKFERIEEIL